MSIVVQASVTVEIPSTPNFLRLVMSEDAIEEDASAATIDIADVTDDALRRIANLWTEALLENASKRRQA